jgi:hypothetical protein
MDLVDEGTASFFQSTSLLSLITAGMLILYGISGNGIKSFKLSGPSAQVAKYNPQLVPCRCSDVNEISRVQIFRVQRLLELKNSHCQREISALIVTLS